MPKELTFADGSSVKADYNRVMSTCFNGASNIVQRGAMSCLDKEGLAEIKKLIDYYMENGARARAIRRRTAAQFGRAKAAAQFGAIGRLLRRRTHPHHPPASAAAMLKSMEGLDDVRRHRRAVRLRRPRGQVVVGHLLRAPRVVAGRHDTGAGFGPGGEGFLVASPPSRARACEEACERLKKAFAGKK